MRVTYDREADAAYIFLKEIRPGSVERTEKVSEGMLVDFGKGNVILGIEVLGPNKIFKRN